MGIKLHSLNQDDVNISVNDSLFNFGDGVFETMLATPTTLINLPYHLERLNHSLIRLGYQANHGDALTQSLHSHLQAFAKEHSSEYFVVKLIVGRGEITRGFRVANNTHCHYFVKCLPYTFNPSLYQGVDVLKCQQKLGLNPLLAGLKRISAMDYVLLRREIDQAQAFDGLLYAIDDNLVECSNANIFLLADNQLYTPDLSQCGVAGTLRAQLLQQGNVSITTVNDEILANADSVFITNAVMGVIPIRSINGVKINCDLSIIRKAIANLNHPCLKFYA